MDVTHDVVDIDPTRMDLRQLVSLDSNPEVTVEGTVFHGGPGEDDMFVDMSPSREVYHRIADSWYQTSGRCAFCESVGVQRRVFTGTDDADPRHWEVLIACDGHTDATFDWHWL